MSIVPLHRWDLSPDEAARIQNDLRAGLVLKWDGREVKTIGGVDMSLKDDQAHAAIVVLRFPELTPIQGVAADAPLVFPYVPGLLSFREGPALLAAFAKLRTEPDLILIDGHGRAHPRRFGIASHIGVLLDKPTVGCAKSLLVGQHAEPGRKRDSTAPLWFQGERVGEVLRTRDNVKPIYVTVGYRISLASAVEFVKQCCDGYRIPKPTREADHYVRELRREHLTGH